MSTGGATFRLLGSSAARRTPRCASSANNGRSLSARATASALAASDFALALTTALYQSGNRLNRGAT